MPEEQEQLVVVHVYWENANGIVSRYRASETVFMPIAFGHSGKNLQYILVTG
jgi:hypothetical protein